MKKNIFGIFVSLVLLIILISCTDDISKIKEIAQKVRVEYSECSGCLECINDFNCPYDAIKIDERTGTTYIDGEKCVQCMQCINNFSCPENAILIKRDIIAPGNIADFSAVSDTLGRLEIQFTAPGDDDTLGSAYRYELTLKDQNNQMIQTDFETPLPNIAGYEENWILNELPPEELITINLQAFDEVNQFSETVSSEVLIQGEYHDEISPAAITDLISNSFEDSLKLTWTAVGDDGLEGIASRYEIRYSENEINDSTWDSAIEFEQNIVPSSPGIIEQLFITDLPEQINYYFAIKTFDEEDNPSEISNNTIASIIGDIIPPADINDLSINSISSNSILLSWTAVGDNGFEGTAFSYVIKVHTNNITEENWDGIPAVEQSIIPQNAGSTESFLITDLEPVTMYYAGIKVLDDVQNISNLSNIITDELKEAYREIKEALKVEAPDYLAQLSEIGPQALLQAPVSLELRSKAQTLALIRKYLFSMVPSQLKKFLHPPLPIDSSMLPTTPQKILKVVELAKKTKKIVVLCSYLKTARTIVAYLQRVNIKAFLITGKVLDKNAILQQFREYPGQAAIVMSPVGERDIDLPEAEQLIIFDSVRTTKTVYQQLKRIRGGTGVFLFYANSYEARKVKSIVKSIIEKYPWSIKVNSPMP